MTPTHRRDLLCYHKVCFILLTNQASTDNPRCFERHYIYYSIHVSILPPPFTGAHEPTTPQKNIGNVTCHISCCRATQYNCGISSLHTSVSSIYIIERATNTVISNDHLLPTQQQQAAISFIFLISLQHFENKLSTGTFSQSTYLQ